MIKSLNDFLNAAKAAYAEHVPDDNWIKVSAEVWSETKTSYGIYASKCGSVIGETPELAIESMIAILTGVSKVDLDIIAPAPAAVQFNEATPLGDTPIAEQMENDSEQMENDSDQTQDCIEETF